MAKKPNPQQPPAKPGRSVAKPNPQQPPANAPLLGVGESAAPDTVGEIVELQAEYGRLAAMGANFLKDTRALEKQLRDEMKEKLKARGLDRDEFVQRKGEVHRALQAAKERRRAELAAAVAAGEYPQEDAEAEIVALGWEPAVAKAVINDAIKAAANPAKTREPEPDPEIEQEKILDPITANLPASRDVNYVDPGQPGGEVTTS